ncbi:HAD family hydrolase [Chloroflexota bacterium]
MKYNAVIFDLFGTLVDNFSSQKLKSTLVNMASIISAPPDDFVQMWLDTFDQRATGFFRTTQDNIEYICRKLGVPIENTQIESATDVRYQFTERCLTPRTDAIRVLSYLKSKGYKTALISDCSAETPIAWKDTPFTPLIEVTVFSCLVGLRKPDLRIYLMATDQLAVEPRTCLYIGDGSSRELTGASQAGMYPVLICVPYEHNTDTYRIDREEWDGPVISSLKEVLDLIK